ncbi:MAG: CPBP family intramembrane metalloprotease [Bacteroidetes bacterium]|nr:CPBP family intramembrane metalloprotease [Bacteroidota bacterium]
MKLFFRYLKDYFREIALLNFLITTLFVAVLIFINYLFGIETRIRAISPWYIQLSVFYIFFTLVFFAAYFFPGKNGFRLFTNQNKLFIILLFTAPFIFSLKMIHWQTPSLFTQNLNYPWNKYWAIILQLPLKLLLIFLFLWFIWKLKFSNETFFGLTSSFSKAKPYFLIILCLVPVIALASTQNDFLHTYPKVKNISFINDYASPLWFWKLLYEISYGLDFVSIELFFRGFLVIGFAHFAGINAILPMAAFYCTIHFGKPLGECISSYFGGIILGIIAYRTRSIIGGLIVHLGLAWMMEIGGYAGLLYFTSH